MNPNDFDDLLRQCDPANQSEDRHDHIELLDESQRQWAELSKRRLIRRRRMSLSLAAIGLFACVGGAVFWTIQLSSDSNDRVSIAIPESKDAATDTTDDSQPHKDAPLSSPPAIETGVPRTASVNPNSLENQPDRPIQNRRIHLRTPTPALASDQLEQFTSFVNDAGTPGSKQWARAAIYLANQSEQTQRASIALVPQIHEQPLKKIAFQLVCEAAGDSVRTPLTRWLADPDLHSSSWSKLVDTGSLPQLAELVEHAETNVERQQLCKAIAAKPDFQSVELLLELASVPQWRAPVGLAADQLNAIQIRTLIMLMRERNIHRRTTAAFILASITGPQVDHLVQSMVVNGRFRHPAYLVLLSRNTPQAKAFLTQAASQPNLTPALVSARFHFASMEKQLQQWIIESRGPNHERSDTSRRLTPELFDGNRCVRNVVRGKQFG